MGVAGLLGFYGKFYRNFITPFQPIIHHDNHWQKTSRNFRAPILVFCRHQMQKTPPV
jgi:hypothetical protein